MKIHRPWSTILFYFQHIFRKTHTKIFLQQFPWAKFARTHQQHGRILLERWSVTKCHILGCEPREWWPAARCKGRQSRSAMAIDFHLIRRVLHWPAYWSRCHQRQIAAEPSLCLHFHWLKGAARFLFYFPLCCWLWVVFKDFCVGVAMKKCSTVLKWLVGGF